MKKWLFILSIFMATGIFACSFFVKDRIAPTIDIIGTPYLACDIDVKDLLNYVSANDEDLKTLFIEERDLLDIMNSNIVTYVAIDDNNNVSRAKSPIEIDDEIKKFHIEIVQPLESQINIAINEKDYFVLQNNCGWNKDGTFKISGVDYTTNGEYSAIVSSNEGEDINVLFKVIQEGAPTIHLKNIYHTAGTNERFNEYYFDSLVDEILDDNDEIPYANIDWNEVLIKNDNGEYDEGIYCITYDVVDSDGNVGNSTLMLEINEEYNIYEPIMEEIQEEIEEIIVEEPIYE